MRAIGIDIGSTSIKGAVLDLITGTVQAPVSRPFPGPCPGLPSGWVEIDPESIASAVDELLAELLAAAPDADRVCFAGQMGGLILVDPQGRPLCRYISWRDQRTGLAPAGSEAFLDRVRVCWEQAGVFEQLGRELQPGSTTTLLAWLHWQNRLPPEALPQTIADFVVGRLIGRPPPMHATHAIGMLDLERDQWHRDAFDRFDLGEVRLPELTFEESSVGTLRRNGRTLSVHGSYGDQQCALRGAALQRNELSLNISTGSQVSRRVAAFRPGPYQSRKYFFGDTLDTVTHLPAGRSLNVLVDLLTELAAAQGRPLQDPWETIQQLVDRVDDTDLRFDLAFFRGPLGERGRIENISTENLSVGTLFHAAYRAMADNYAAIAARFAPGDWRSIVVSGGMISKSPRLGTLLRERFSAPLREAAAEETLLGLLDIARSSSSIGNRHPEG